MTSPIVLVHGVGLDAKMWDRVIAQIGDDRPCIAIDMAGHGALKHRTADTLAGFVDALELDIAKVTDGPVNMVGFSMGAMVAAAYTLKRPNMVSRLIMMNAIHQRDEQARLAVLDRLSVARNEGLMVIADAAISRWFSEAFTLENPEIIGAVREHLITNDMQSYLSAYEVFATADAEVAPRLGEITCPVLAVTADGDSNSTPEMSNAIAANVQDGHTVVWGGLAHGAPIEDPARVAMTLTDFFDEE